MCMWWEEGTEGNIGGLEEIREGDRRGNSRQGPCPHGSLGCNRN